MMNDSQDLDVVAFQVAEEEHQTLLGQVLPNPPQVHYPSFDFIQTVQHATVTKKMKWWKIR